MITRFAPSPTGLLHPGHAYSAWFAAQAAAESDGTFLLRIEDIDSTRCRPEFEDAIYEDLAWLGLEWQTPVRRQSEHLDDYAAALAKLEADGLVYPCFCTRREIQREIARAGNAPHGPEGPLYPGTCRRLSDAERQQRIAAGEPHALRLDVATGIIRSGPIDWHDRRRGIVHTQPERLGDVILGRKDIAVSYHLAVTVDDAIQNVTLVTRGEDLFECTHIHRLLQALLGLPVPMWDHHPLQRDKDGKRYAKRDQSVTLQALRKAGVDPAHLRSGWNL